jgi:hypothetical protein
MLRKLLLFAVVLPVLALFASAPAHSQDAAAIQRWRMRCALLGGDLTEPLEILAFRRCLASLPRDPANSSGPVKNPFEEHPLLAQ